MQKFCSNSSTTSRLALFALLSLLLTACEAPLVLDAVEEAKKQHARRTDTFLAVAAQGENLYVVGSHGLVLNSNDDGASWNRQELPGYPALIDITTCDDSTVAALSFEGDVWISEDAGASWNARKVGTEETTQAITCDGSNKLWVVGAFATILNSADKGENWSSYSTEEDIILNNIQFINDDEVFVSGEFGTLMKSSDGGQNWETMPPMQEDFYPQDMYFENSQMGWVVGLVGVILHTSDGGRSWTPQESNTLVSLFRMEKTSGPLLVVGGEGKILGLENDQWSEMDHGQTIRLYLGGIVSLQNNRVLVAGPGGILHILDMNQLKPKYAGLFDENVNLAANSEGE